ncbi:MAG TPA: hypothetical protein VFU21_31215 [Kofleriaceae bacterium]|nr:hypothetical protein [Kofleriaceae bacterium]
MKRALWLVGVLAGAGCGLVDSDVTDIDISLPEREVTVDTADWQLSGSERLQEVDCSEDESVCSTGLAELCGSEDVCAGVCGASRSCEVSVQVALWHTFDLRAERPELQQIEGQPLVDVRIDRVYYTVGENSLDVDSPPLSVYVAPEGVMSPFAADAQLVGTIPSVPAATTIEEADVELTDEGKDRLAARMKDYDTPFNLIVASELRIQAGDTLPHGRMVTVIKATAVASTGL